MANWQLKLMFVKNSTSSPVDTGLDDTTVTISGVGVSKTTNGHIVVIVYK